MALRKKAACIAAALALALAVGASASAAPQGGESADAGDSGAEKALVFSTPYYTIEVPADLAPYVDFRYEEGPGAGDVASGSGRYATHATDVTLREDPTAGSPSASFHVACYADESRADGPVLFADTGLATPDGLKIGIQVARGTGPEPDPGAEELLEAAKGYVRTAKNG